MCSMGPKGMMKNIKKKIMTASAKIMPTSKIIPNILRRSARSPPAQPIKLELLSFNFGRKNGATFPIQEIVKFSAPSDSFYLQHIGIKIHQLSLIHIF